MTTQRPTHRSSRRRRWTSVRLSARDVAHDLQQRHSLRWHGLCIGTLTLLGMLLAAWVQKLVGVHMLSVRYAITLTVGYGIYLLVLRWWAARLLDDEEEGADVDGVDALNVALDVADLARAVPRSGGPRMPEVPSLGDAADVADAGKGLGELAGDALEGLGSADEGAVVVIPVVAIFLIGAAILAGAGALAMLFFSWDVLLAVAVELAFSVAAARVATRVEREGWITAAVRLTWKPLLGALLCAVLLGATIDHFMPQVDSLPEAVRVLQGK
ncbi:hypothetical protein CLU86_3858 [Acidovorax sp. 62]|uniref:hypothetical protein n=1 Tax=Acidovorax sp. 62 TaxID=2035203 RepID=UPI000C19FC10|nr:hypothetical protein [Acidovorax sp. 62]PIF92908.1 hypothetical protein CLU86_3858 [Acidovorax sp. 62]